MDPEAGAEAPNAVTPGMAKTMNRDAVIAACADNINDAMKIAATHALAGLISDSGLTADYIIPAAFDPRVKDALSLAVRKAAKENGAARQVYSERS